MADVFKIVDAINMYANTYKVGSVTPYINQFISIPYVANSDSLFKVFSYKTDYLISDVNKESYLTIGSYEIDDTKDMQDVSYEIYDSITKEKLGTFLNVKNQINILNLFNGRQIDVKVIDNTNKYNGKYIGDVDTQLDYQKYLKITKIYHERDSALFKITYSGNPTLTLIGGGTLVKVDDSHYKVNNITSQFKLSLVDYVDTNAYMLEKTYEKIKYWQVDKTESFNTDPANKYKILFGNVNVTYDSTNKLLKLKNDTTQGFVSWFDWGGYTNNVAFEMDFNYFADPQNRNHVGMFYSTDGTNPQGYRLYSLDNAIGMSSWTSGTSESAMGTFDPNNALRAGNNYTLRFERLNNKWYAYINGIKLPNGVNNGGYNMVYCGFFVWGAEIHVKEIRSYQYK